MASERLEETHKSINERYPSEHFLVDGKVIVVRHPAGHSVYEEIGYSSIPVLDTKAPETKAMHKLLDRLYIYGDALNIEAEEDRSTDREQNGIQMKSRRIAEMIKETRPWLWLLKELGKVFPDHQKPDDTNTPSGVVDREPFDHHLFACSVFYHYLDRALDAFWELQLRLLPEEKMNGVPHGDASPKAVEFDDTKALDEMDEEVRDPEYRRLRCIEIRDKSFQKILMKDGMESKVKARTGKGSPIGITLLREANDTADGELLRAEKELRPEIDELDILLSDVQAQGGAYQFKPCAGNIGSVH